MVSIKSEPEDHVLRRIQDAYLTRKVRKTRDCVESMARNGLFEADVEKVFVDATSTEKVVSTTGDKADKPITVRYVIYGKSTKGAGVCCKFSSYHHPGTNDSIDWVLTSFESQ